MELHKDAIIKFAATSPIGPPEPFPPNTKLNRSSVYWAAKEPDFALRAHRGPGGGVGFRAVPCELLHKVVDPLSPICQKLQEHIAAGDWRLSESVHVFQELPQLVGLPALAQAPVTQPTQGR